MKEMSVHKTYNNEKPSLPYPMETPKQKDLFRSPVRFIPTTTLNVNTWERKKHSRKEMIPPLMSSCWPKT